MSAASKTPREIVAELGLPHREPVVDYYVMVAHPFDDGALEPLRAAGYKLTPSGARHTIVGPVQKDSPETTVETRGERGLRKLAERWIEQRSFPEDEAEHQDQLLEAWLAGAETVAGLLNHVPSVTEAQMRAHVWRGEDEAR